MTSVALGVLTAAAAVLAVVGGVGVSAPGPVAAQAVSPPAAPADSTTGPSSTTTGRLSGPSITLSRLAARPGEEITVVFDGWEGRLVTLTVCGNQARQGSADCNNVNSRGVRLAHVESTPVATLVVVSPPAPCPCVVRASSATTNEVVAAPLEIVDHPVAPVIDPVDRDLLAVSVEASPANGGAIDALAAALGGSGEHLVTVTVRNLTTESLDEVRVSGEVGRSATQELAGFELVPGAIGPGRTWTGEARLALPAPMVGDYQWRVTASGAGAPVTAAADTTVVPWLLVALVAVLALDVVVMVLRFVRRRAQRHEVRARARAEQELVAVG